MEKAIAVIPGITNHLSFDAILNQILHPSREPLDILQLKIKLLDENGIEIDHIIYEGENTCGLYRKENKSFEFTPTDNLVTLHIEAINLNSVYNNTQYLIDNLTLAVPTEPALAFYYDDRGHRIRKENFVYAGDEPIRDITWYVRDASGSPLAIYQGTSEETQTTAELKELPIYGLSRLGIYQKYMNDYVYQLTDHLGNVRATLRRGKGNELYVLGATDYYPFGMPMPGRSLTGSENYRYAYQGQEDGALKNSPVDYFSERASLSRGRETGKEAFQLRLWDGRIGRWLITDPAKQYASPYMGMGNNPIITYDKDGAIGENDYRLNKDGSIELIALTGDNFDRLFVDGVENPS